MTSTTSLYGAFWAFGVSRGRHGACPPCANQSSTRIARSVFHRVTRTIPLQPSPFVPFEAGGALWVTDFDNSDLWRIVL